MIPSPNGEGVFAGAASKVQEAFSVLVSNLIIGETYVLKFYQSHGTNYQSSLPNGYTRWKLTFGSETLYGEDILINEFPTWEQQDFAFTASATTQELILRSVPGALGSGGYAHTYSLIDGIELAQVLGEISTTSDLCINQSIPFSFDTPNASEISTYSWTFQNANGTTVFTSTTSQPAYNFQNPGAYTISLDVTLNNGCTFDFSETFQIEDCDSSCDTLSGLIKIQNASKYCNGVKLDFFFDQTTSGPQINSYNWTFYDLDGTTILHNYNTSNVITTYNYPSGAVGDYLVTVAINYDNNCTAQFQRIFPIINCDSTTDDNSFCTSEMGYFPTVGDLTPGGANIAWYLTETGGIPLNNDEELVEEAEDPTGAIYWWDDINDSSTVRVQVTAFVNSGVLDSGGPGDNEYDYQEFSEGQNAIVANLIPVGPNIKWYDEASSTNPLSNSVPLVNGLYYVEELGVTTCRLEVLVFIGTHPPVGDGIQYLCPGQTIQDIEIELQDDQSTAVWYLTETGGTPVSVTTALSSGTTYYVAQIDGFGFESEHRLAITIFLNSVEQPVVPFPVQTFDIDQTPPPTVADLIAYGYDIKWYPSETGGNVFGVSEALVHGNTYWAEQNVGVCPSTRVPVQVQIIEIEEPPLLGCEKFKPQPGDRYVINAWVREQGVNPINPQVSQFNNSEESALFVDLLNHLLFVTQHEDNDIHDLSIEGYIPTSPTENLDFDPLIPFVKYIDNEIKLKVYDYERIPDDYGRTVGFKFKLSPHTSAPLFEWKSPFVVLDGVTQNYRYPINDNPGLDIVFTNAAIQGANITITSSFMANESPIQNIPNYTYTSISGLESSITEYDYEDIPNFQPMDYVETLVELIYVDEEQNVLPIPEEEVLFLPKGEIIDGWQRVYAEFKIPGNAAQMTINLKNKSENQLAYFDDIRMHPYNSNMKTFVYHPVTQRLMSELDENNYATFYEYDAEGGLIRVKKETEKGIYTIQETRSSTTKQTN